jgi:hypothetical protein
VTEILVTSLCLVAAILFADWLRQAIAEYRDDENHR